MVSHPLRMRKALGSFPSVSMLLYFQGSAAAVAALRFMSVLGSAPEGSCRSVSSEPAREVGGGASRPTGKVTCGSAPPCAQRNQRSASCVYQGCLPDPDPSVTTIGVAVWPRGPRARTRCLLLCAMAAQRSSHWPRSPVAAACLRWAARAGSLPGPSEKADGP